MHIYMSLLAQSFFEYAYRTTNNIKNNEETLSTAPISYIGDCI